MEFHPGILNTETPVGERFPVRYDRILSFDPYEDGLGIMRDAQTAKPQTFRTGDGWFACNMKEDFRIDLEAGTCTCPAGQATRIIRPSGTRTGPTGRTHRLKGFRSDGAVCGVRPLWSRCVAAKPGTGRTVQMHPQEALLQQARALQRSEAFGGYRQRRVVRSTGWSSWESASPATSAASKPGSSCTWLPPWPT